MCVCVFFFLVHLNGDEIFRHRISERELLNHLKPMQCPERIKNGWFEIVSKSINACYSNDLCSLFLFLSNKMTGGLCIQTGFSSVWMSWCKPFFFFFLISNVCKIHKGIYYLFFLFQRGIKPKKQNDLLFFQPGKLKKAGRLPIHRERQIELALII